MQNSSFHFQITLCSAVKRNNKMHNYVYSFFLVDKNENKSSRTTSVYDLVPPTRPPQHLPDKPNED
jgi:hypothetical protein